MHCRRFRPWSLNRREWLWETALGAGGISLWSLLAGESLATAPNDPFAPRETHFPPRAKNVIFLYMDGGPSQVDTFDPKPRLQAENGQPFKMKIQPTQFDNNGNTLGSPWKFSQHGESGLPVSELFPHVAECADDLCVIRSLTSKFSEHTNANYFLHTGHGLQGRPSMGAWIGYGLGTECQDLPAYVVLNGGLIPPGGLDCFGSGFLPATYQGSVFKRGATPVADIARREPTEQAQLRKLELMRQFDEQLLESTGPQDAVESAIRNYELAFRMQVAVPDLMDLSQETQATQQAYGLEAELDGTKTFGHACLVARRLIERGVRFIQLTCPGGAGDRWDQHSNLRDGHAKNSRHVDQPIAALLKDLKSRGLLDETLVLWGGEFGRTPFAQGSNGRDHNPFGYSVWMAGGGVQGGMAYGATDEYGYHAIENRLEMHDLHATMLHLLGIDHERLTFRFSGRDMRLTDVHGRVIDDIIA
ncbi:MAG: DUF1501 domain-containing protein [Planctomycetaceae bacterium]|nr:DUF1501 domain-containing protein [Planctomycetaceae bacterium]